MASSECVCPAMWVPDVIPVSPQYRGLILKATVSAFFHPMEYAKLLIQLGHEPIAPKHTRTWLGRPALSLPSVFQYMGYIRSYDGVTGLYRGLGPKLINVGLGAVVRNQLGRVLPECRYRNQNWDDLKPHEQRIKVTDNAIRECAEHLAVLIVTQPLHVCAVRSMAQFVGGEDKYDGIIQALVSIYRENGIFGYWSGLVPRALGEMATVLLTAGVTFFLNSYVLEDKRYRSYTAHIASFFASSLCYPFQVVGNCMIVSSSGLAAGLPPFMPLYRSWLDCWVHLGQEKQLKRGNSLLFRYYTGPQVIVGNKAVAVKQNVYGRVKK